MYNAVMEKNHISIYHLLASFPSIVLLWVDYIGYLLLKETHVRRFGDPGYNKFFKPNENIT